MLLKKTGLNQVIVKRSITVKPTTSLLEARDILFKHKIRRLVVVGAKNKPVGIITEKDVARTVYASGGKSIKKIQATDIIVLPEMFNTGFCPEFPEFAERMNGPTVKWMLKKSKEKKFQGKT